VPRKSFLSKNQRRHNSAGAIAALAEKIFQGKKMEIGKENGR